MKSMDRRNFLHTSAKAAGCAAASLLFSCGSQETELPNILFIVTDDQAQWAVGSYGNRDIYTPRMDRLAREGMKFTRAFTAPVCSPSRAMTMSGYYSAQVGIGDWISPDETFGLDRNAATLGDILKEKGYDTGYIGKWHLGKEKEYHPVNRGFDYFMGFLEGGNTPLDPVLEINGEKRKVPGFLTDILTDDAIKYLGTKRERPFALFFHTRAPHAAYAPVPETDSAPYAGKTLTVPEVPGEPREKWETITKEYYASVTSVDRNLGRLMNALEDLGIADNTLVIFTGDNGYNIGHHGVYSKGNALLIGTDKRRPNMFDNSVLVPLIIRWPGRIKPGSVCDEMVTSLDYFPTFMELTGSAPTDTSGRDGMSMAPLFLGRPPEKWRDTVFCEYNMHHGQIAKMRMIRTEQWKLVLHFENEGTHELYNLENDPGEKKNLYGEESARAVREDLRKRLTAWGVEKGIEMG